MGRGSTTEPHPRHRRHDPDDGGRIRICRVEATEERLAHRRLQGRDSHRHGESRHEPGRHVAVQGPARQGFVLTGALPVYLTRTSYTVSPKSDLPPV